MSAGIFIGVVIIFLVLVAAVIFLILWLSERNKTTTPSKELDIVGTKFTLDKLTTLIAIWESVGNSTDVISLYADTKVIDLDASGKPTGNVLSSGPVPSSSKTISISNLSPNTSYFVKLD